MPEISNIDKKSIHYKVKPFGLAKGAIKDVSSSSRIVTGFFNTFNFMDSDYDVVMPGAFKKSISERGPNSEAVSKIKHALHHDLTQLPGKIKVLEEKTIDGISGMYFETKMSNTTLGTDTMQNYLEEIYDNHSFGFQYIDVQLIEPEHKDWKRITDAMINPEMAIQAGGLYACKELAVFEGSTVAFGANSLTPFLGVKSGNKESLKLALIKRIDLLESTLRNGTQSDDMMKTFEIQSLQLKQMVSELADTIDLNKEKKSAIIEEKVEVPGKSNLNYSELSSKFKL